MAAAPKPVERQVIISSGEQPVRFTLPLLHEHGLWLADRLTKYKKELDLQQALAWFRSLLNSNEHLFLATSIAVCLFEVVRGSAIDGKAIVHERFVWIKSLHSKEQPTGIEHAIILYDAARRWARGMGADVMVVGEHSDISIDEISKFLGPLMERTLRFARI